MENDNGSKVDEEKKNGITEIAGNNEIAHRRGKKLLVL